MTFHKYWRIFTTGLCVIIAMCSCYQAKGMGGGVEQNLFSPYPLNSLACCQQHGGEELKIQSANI